MNRVSTLDCKDKSVLDPIPVSAWCDTKWNNLFIYNLTKFVTEVLGGGGRERSVMEVLGAAGGRGRWSSGSPLLHPPKCLSVEVLKPRFHLFVRLSRSWNSNPVCSFVCWGLETQIPTNILIHLLSNIFVLGTYWNLFWKYGDFFFFFWPWKCGHFVTFFKKIICMSHT